jgi:predicted nicotinamide N-methyase
MTFKQIGNGEMKGIGTGAVVWPAAHVLAKFIECRYPEGLCGYTVCDIGSGTGCVGLVAAALGATVTLTDQNSVEELIAHNIELCTSSHIVPPGRVRFREYSWGDTPRFVEIPFDIILVSDCVLPKLYPIEPLIEVRQLLKHPWWECSYLRLVYL